MKTRLIECPEPGLYKDIPNEVYHSWNAVNKSMLSVLKKGTPAHVEHWLQYGDQKHTNALSVGDAFDDAVLDEERYRCRWQLAQPCQALIGSGPKKGEACGKESTLPYKPADKVNEQWLCGIHSKKSGTPTCTTVLADSDLAMITNMVASIHHHPTAEALVWGDVGVNQLSVVWDEQTPHGPVRCKCRYDRWTQYEGNSCFVDLKSARSASPFLFRRDAEKWDYPLQAAHYSAGLRGIEALTGKKHRHRKFYFVVIEKSLDGLGATRHRVEVYIYNTHDLAEVEAERKQMLAEYAHCMKTDTWPGRVARLNELRISPFYIGKDHDHDED